MTKQEVFNKVVLHLMTQKSRALVLTSYLVNGELKPQTECRYLTPEGKKCAIGCLIPDGHPAQKFEGDLGPMLEAYPDLNEIFPDWGRFFVGLQNIHDVNDIYRWPATLTSFAKDNGLTVPDVLFFSMTDWDQKVVEWKNPVPNG